MAGDVWQLLGSLGVVGECRVHREAVMGLAFTCDATRVMSVGRDALAKMLSLPSLDQVERVWERWRGYGKGWER